MGQATVTPEIETWIVAAARSAGLPVELARALVLVESAGDPWAWNPEPKYRWLWDVRAGKPFRRVTDVELAAKFPPRDFPALAGVDPDAEWWGQQSSWGLCQIMGAVARERGFRGRFLGELHDPALNLGLGFAHLASLRDRYVVQAGWPGVVAAYNAGSPQVQWDGAFANQDYVDKINRALNGHWPK